MWGGLPGNGTPEECWQLLGWVVETGEEDTEWRLPTVTRADRLPTGEASLARGRLASRQRLHEAEVVFHQVQGSRPCRTPMSTAHTQRCFAVKPAMSSTPTIGNAVTRKGTGRCGL